MTQDFFKAQMKRLQTHFGDRHFNPEFTQLIWREIHDMSESGFARFCDVVIGSRTHNKPPLLSEFREARLAESKRRFENEVRGAANTMFGPSGTPEERKAHVLKVLSKEFGNVSSIAEALEIARMRLRVARAAEDAK